MIYVNFDLETTGSLPDKHAILSFGAVATDSEQNFAVVSELSVNFEVPNSRGWEEDTVTWWITQPQAYAACRKDCLNPAAACAQIQLWLESLLVIHSPSGRLAFVANPIAFDLPFLRSYMKEYVGNRWKEFSMSQRAGLGGLDLPTLASAVLGVEYTDGRRSKWPERWKVPTTEHTHVAIDDARLQSYAFVQMMKELRQR